MSGLDSLGVVHIHVLSESLPCTCILYFRLRRYNVDMRQQVNVRRQEAAIAWNSASASSASNTDELKFQIVAAGNATWPLSSAAAESVLSHYNRASREEVYREAQDMLETIHAPGISKELATLRRSYHMNSANTLVVGDRLETYVTENTECASYAEADRLYNTYTQEALHRPCSMKHHGVCAVKAHLNFPEYELFSKGHA